MNTSHLSLYIIFIACLISLQARANRPLLDSIGVENVEGKQVIIHKIVSKDTYYSLGRLYQVGHKEIAAYNQNKALKVGQTAKIPTQRPFQTEPATPAQADPQPAYTTYIVGQGETLYTIAKRFQVRVDDIISFNQLQGDAIQPDQQLRIPQEPLPVQSAQINQAEAIEDQALEEEREALSVPSNRYGITQVSDKGVGVWMEDLNTADGKMLALHKTAPVGTIIKITNPMTQRTTYAKVVGKYTDNSETREAIVVISKATANLLGIIDKRFLINISYGVAK